MLAGALALTSMLSAGAAGPPAPDTIEERVAACTSCHGRRGEGKEQADASFPRLAGKPADYLFRQLRNFRSERRRYAPMAHLLQPLSEDYLHEIATYFSVQHPPLAPETPSRLGPARAEAARALVMSGERRRALPACSACHGEALAGAEPGVPGLLGLQGYYINAQLAAWKSGVRHADAPDCMAQVASLLSAQEISDIALWLAAQPRAADARALGAGLIRPPLRCGSLQP